jgi:hypothetical protein
MSDGKDEDVAKGTPDSINMVNLANDMLRNMVPSVQGNSQLAIPVTPWERAKQMGSTHYKNSGVEPIDLYKAGGYLEHFVIGNIIKYAYRLGKRRQRDKIADLNKIIHYATLLKVDLEGKE